MDAKILTLAYSTIANRVFDIQDIKLGPNVCEAVYLQASDTISVEDFASIQKKVYSVSGVGVAKSRNAAIRNCSSKYIWFLDDDVMLTKADVDFVAEFAALNSPDVILVSVDNGISKKIVPNVIRRRDLLSVGTIQIIVNVDKVRSLGRFFPENMGAGTIYPVCDEPVFLNRLWQNGFSFEALPNIFIKHNGESSGMVFDSRGHAVSRAMLFREFYGMPLCIIASFIFLIKRWNAIGRHVMGLFNYVKPS